MEIRIQPETHLPSIHSFVVNIDKINYDDTFLSPIGLNTTELLYCIDDSITTLIKRSDFFQNGSKINIHFLQ